MWLPFLLVVISVFPLVFFSCSDPYVKVSLYKGAALTADYKTSTIKKVSNGMAHQLRVYKVSAGKLVKCVKRVVKGKCTDRWLTDCNF